MLLQYGIPNTNRYNIKIEKITDRIDLIRRADTFDNTFDQLKSIFVSLDFGLFSISFTWGVMNFVLNPEFPPGDQ